MPTEGCTSSVPRGPLGSGVGAISFGGVTWTPVPDPFPHVVVDGYWPDDLLRQVADEFPPEHHSGWVRYHNDKEGKLEGPPVLWGPMTKRLFTDMASLTPVLSDAFAIDDLQMEVVGGGYHLIPPREGRLAVHTDFSRSPVTGLYRRLNFLVFLNEGWDDPGGRLEMWDEGGLAREVVPEFNRTVVFATSTRSWHGHPRPASRWRRSVAAYFFSSQPPPDYAGDHSTIWRRHDLV
jgi:2OG-Fe(II) oxygenase superfamily